VRIYKAEKDAGINLQSNSLAFVTAQVQIQDIKKYFDGMSASDLIKTISTIQTVDELIGQEQPDLALVVSILVSTGWNLNDDIFTPDETWKARFSPIHKPINDNHQADKILGHIIQSKVLDKSGNEIELSDDDELPEDFDIEVAGVLYRYFPALAEKINDIIEKAKAGEMFVSMEAWFPDFCYGIIDSETGETKLIERNENTAFLTKHLRSYGGTGKYQGYKIGRVLKDIIFGAQGFVDVPANPDSVIKVAANKTDDKNIFVTAKLDDILGGGVEDVDGKQLKELQAKLEEAQAILANKEKEVGDLQKVIEEFKSKDYDGQIAALTTQVQDLTADADKLETVLAEKGQLQEQLDEVTKRAEKSEADLEEIRKNEVARDRLIKLSEVKQIDDKEATLAELREVTEETFAILLKYAGDKSVVVEDTKADTKEEEETDEKDADQTKATLDSAEEDSSADFNAGNEGEASEIEKWLSTAKALCGQKDEEK